MNTKISITLILLGLIDPTVAQNETCSICADGFDSNLSDFQMPPLPGLDGIAGMSCSQIEGLVGNFQSDSNECFGFSLVQGFCCPKCFLCDTFENDMNMTNADSILSPDQGLTCGLMKHFYYFLSHDAPNSCPANPSDLDTDHIPGGLKVAPGLDIRGYCGCPGFEDSKPDPPVTNLCPAGEEVPATKNDLVLVPGTNFTCAGADNLASFVTDREAYEVQGTVLTYEDDCCDDSGNSTSDSGDITTSAAPSDAPGGNNETEAVADPEESSSASMMKMTTSIVVATAVGFVIFL